MREQPRRASRRRHRHVQVLHGAARRTRAIIRQNLTWALAYNVLAIPLAAMALIPPYVAALGMSLSSLVVVCNALRLQRTTNSSLIASHHEQPSTVGAMS